MDPGERKEGKGAIGAKVELEGAHAAIEQIFGAEDDRPALRAGRSHRLHGTDAMDPGRRWEERCRQAGDTTVWPVTEASELLHAIRSHVLEGNDRRLRSASRAFALANRDVALLVRRLGCLRELFGEDGFHDVPDLNQRVQRCLDLVTAVGMESATAALADAALTDTLTGVGNRRSLQETAGAALTQSSRNKEPLSLAVIDLNGLKEINDTRGHAAGDRALTDFTTSLRSVMREDDRLFRVGGDEFVLLLPGASGEAVTKVMSRAERLKAPAFSWGAATCPAEGRDLDSLMKLADSRLYRSREAEGYYARRHPQEVDPVLAMWLRIPAAGTASPAKKSEKPRRRSRAGLLVGGVAVLAALLMATVVKPGPAKTILLPYAPSVSVTPERARQTRATTAAPAHAGAKASSPGRAATNLPVAVSKGGSNSSNAGSVVPPVTRGPSVPTKSATTLSTPPSTLGGATGSSQGQTVQGQPPSNGSGSTGTAGSGGGHGSGSGQASGKAQSGKSPSRP